MSVNVSTRQAYSEIDEFLDLLSEEKRNEIPQKLRDLFKREKDCDYKKGINFSIPIRNQNLKDETLAIIALLNLNYWCKDESEKERLKSIYAKNEEQYQELLQEKYSPDNLFTKKEDTQNQIQITEVKEPLFKKILNRILEIFKWK